MRTRLTPTTGNHDQTVGGLKFSRLLETYGEGMSEQATFFGRLWAKQHGKQFGISATVAGASGVILVLCVPDSVSARPRRMERLHGRRHRRCCHFAHRVPDRLFPNSFAFEATLRCLKNSWRFNPRPNFGDAKRKAWKQPKRWAPVIWSSGMLSLTARREAVKPRANHV